MPVKFPNKSGESYRPSNGTEGAAFMNRFCDRCAYYQQQSGGFYDCEKGILAQAELFTTDEEEYPDAWIYNEEGWPVCTEYKKDTSKDEPDDILPF